MNQQPSITIDWQSIIASGGFLDIEQLRYKSPVFVENASVSIFSIGDGVGLIEFHSKANSVNDEICGAILRVCEKGRDMFRALVVGNAGKHFSAGADLAMMLRLATEGRWKEVNHTIIKAQRTSMAIKYSPLPVVAAPFSSALGAGCEFCLHSRLVVLASKTNMGLVETSVGLIPGGGGTKELGLRAIEKAKDSGDPLLASLAPVFATILSAQVSRSGAEAVELFLRPDDGVVESAVSPIGPAKAVALQLAAGGSDIGAPVRDIPVFGSAGVGRLLEKTEEALEHGIITEHDALIARHLARILCGGEGSAGTADEQHFLDLEREAFLSLLGTSSTQERIQYMLTNKKPLHN